MSELEEHVQANAELVSRRLEMGDAPELPRQVDHTVVLPRKQVGRATTALGALGFTARSRTGILRVRLEVSREDAVDRATVDAVTREILAVVRPLGGSYDGWGAVLEGPDVVD